MPNIHVLPVHLVNKIAAGEVIERPASIVKELVENSIDAHARRIDVTIEDGGMRLIAISDNGSGMGSDDLALAFVPHATSKLTGEDDLFAINTMGFRGEALASIASVSHAHIRTKKNTDASNADPQSPGIALPGLSAPALTESENGADTENVAFEIDASGETLGQVRPCAAPAGTTVTIRDLFFNTPARRKFMKSAPTELGHITEQIIRLALPHPHVAFTLTHNGRTVQNLPATTSTLQRVADVFGKELADGLIPVAARSGRGCAVQGIIGRPSAARASANWQYFFLNGRYIRDRLLSHALKEAYRGVIEPSRWPVAFVFLSLDPAEVDVNVHPTKVEVRFRDSQSIHGQLLAALRETLNRANLAPSAQFAQTGELAEPPAIADPQATAGSQAIAGLPVPGESLAISQTGDTSGAPADDEKKHSLRQALVDFFTSIPAPQPALQFGEDARPRWAPRSDFSTGGFGHAQPPDAPAHASVQDAQLAPPRGPDTRDPQETPAQVAPPVAPAPAVATGSPAGQTSVFQLHNAYIIAADADGLIIIDQHALHERLVYNDLHRRLAEGPLMSQRLLIPQTVNVSPAQLSAAQDHTDLLNRLGLELEPFGPNTLAIQRLPVLLTSRGANVMAFVREVLDRLVGGGPAEAENMLEELLEMMACKAAVKAGDPLSPAEMEALLARRLDCEKGSSCPHGRPTTLKLPLKDLEKQFKRT